MHTRRKPGWERRLAAFIASVATRQFQWGKLDCVHFARRAVEVQTEISIQFDLEWASKLEARSVLDGELLSKRVGEVVEGMFEPCPPSFAQRGDLCIVVVPAIWAQEEEPAECCGVLDFDGQHVVVLGMRGTYAVPRAAVTHAWRL